MQLNRYDGIREDHDKLKTQYDGIVKDNESILIELSELKNKLSILENKEIEEQMNKQE